MKWLVFNYLWILFTFNKRSTSKRFKKNCFLKVTPVSFFFQVFLGSSGAHDIDGNELPRLVYVSREKRPGYQHHKKAGAENALVYIPTNYHRETWYCKVLFLSYSIYALKRLLPYRYVCLQSSQMRPSFSILIVITILTIARPFVRQCVSWWIRKLVETYAMYNSLRGLMGLIEVTDMPTAIPFSLM